MIFKSSSTLVLTINVIYMSYLTDSQIQSPNCSPPVLFSLDNTNQLCLVSSNAMIIIPTFFLFKGYDCLLGVFSSRDYQNAETLPSHIIHLICYLSHLDHTLTRVITPYVTPSCNLCYAFMWRHHGVLCKFSKHFPRALSVYFTRASVNAAEKTNPGTFLLRKFVLLCCKCFPPLGNTTVAAWETH